MRDKIAMWIAWKLPKRVVYWCAIRVTAHATTGDYSHQIVPDLTAMDAVQRWDAPFDPGWSKMRTPAEQKLDVQVGRGVARHG